MPIKVGDEVAVLPAHDAPPSAVIEIISVSHAGSIFVQLADGRTFATLGGKGLNNSAFIVPATAQHHSALRGAKDAAVAASV